MTPVSRLIGGSLVWVALLATNPARAQVPAEVRGRVTDGATGAVVARAQIDVVGRTEHTLSAIDGSVVMRGLEPRRVTIRVRAIGYSQQDADVDVENGRSVTLDVVLRPRVASLDPIVVRSARDSTSSRTFDRHAIEMSGRRDVGELLQAVPGVVVTQAGGPGSPTRVSIRGSGSNEVLVVVDGVPINSVITGEADLSRIALETVERVTVLPGAQSARYGGRALAGVVLIDTRRSDGDVSGTASLGAWGERNIGLSLGRVGASSGLRLGGSVIGDYREIRGDFSYPVPDVRGGGTATRSNADVRSGNVLTTGSLDGEDGSLQVRAEWQGTSRGLAGSIVQPSTTGRQKGNRITGGFDGRWFTGRFTWTADADLAHEHEAFADPSPPFGVAFAAAADASSARLSASSTATSALGSAAVGAEVRALDVSSTTLALGAPHRQNVTGVWTDVRAVHDLGATSIAADLSARLDWDSLISGATASPRAGLTATRGQVSLSAFAGGAYAPPSLADQFFHEGVLVRANPNLQPERVRHEVELRAAVRDVRAGAVELNGEAAAYRADVSGMILWLPNFQFIWSPANFDVRRAGWELNGGLVARSIGADLRGSLSRSDVTYVGPVLSGQVAYRPSTTASVTAGLTRGDARFEVTTRYVGDRRTVAGSPLNVLEPYSLTDVKLAIPLARSAWAIDATLGLENLFDRPASMLVDYPFPGRTWTVAVRTRRAQDASAIPTISNGK
jgi:vitamin B12 transporter